VPGTWVERMESTFWLQVYVETAMTAQSELNVDYSWTPPPTGWVYGRVMDARTGRPVEFSGIPSGQYTLSSGSHTASTEGGFFFIQLPPGKEHLLLIESATHAFPRTSHRVKAQAGVFTFVELWVLPFEALAIFDASTGGRIETMDGAEVVFPADALDATGQVTAQLAWLNAADPNHLSAFPGGFRTTEGELLESFSAIAIEVRDAEGKLLNLKEGAKALATIPATGNVRSDDIPLWFYDEEAGLWKEEGMLTGCESGFCLAELPFLPITWWNIDIPFSATCLTVCVTDEKGNPVVGAYIEARGVDYNGITINFSGKDGCACLPVRIDSEVSVTAAVLGSVGHQNVNTNGTALSCGSPESECTPVSLTLIPLKFQAILSFEGWGDLDAHLTGPSPDGGDFHVFYENHGSLSESPFAWLNVDSCGGILPEIISLSACSAGTYRYSVVDAFFAQGFVGSNATVILLLPDGSLRRHSLDVSLNPHKFSRWTVGELQCNASCKCTWVPINTFEDESTPKGPGITCESIKGF